MSDPVSNAEVEDVLASIRRLVSEEKQPTSPGRESHDASKQQAEVQPEVDNLTQSGGKLVLTPSLRVMDAAGGTDVSPSVAAEGVFDPKGESAPEIEQNHHTPDETPTAEIPPDDDATQNARTAAGLVVGLAASQRKDVKSGLRDTATAEVPVGGNVEQPQRGQSEAFKEEARSNPNGLSAKIAALEAVIGKRNDEFEPDGVAQTDEYAGTEALTLAWEDHVAERTEPDSDTTVEPSPEVAREPVHDTPRTDPVVEKTAASPASTEADNIAALLDEDAVLDEETLRAMVSDIVREELQGALGERITRNVRKLVRREIQRALAAQDLE